MVLYLQHGGVYYCKQYDVTVILRICSYYKNCTKHKRAYEIKYLKGKKY